MWRTPAGKNVHSLSLNASLWLVTSLTRIPGFIDHDILFDNMEHQHANDNAASNYDCSPKADEYKTR